MHVPNIALLPVLFRKVQAIGNNYAPQSLFRCSRIGAGAIIFGADFCFPNSKFKAESAVCFEFCAPLGEKEAVFDAKERSGWLLWRLERSFAESVLDFC